MVPWLLFHGTKTTRKPTFERQLAFITDALTMTKNSLNISGHATSKFLITSSFLLMKYTVYKINRFSIAKSIFFHNKNIQYRHKEALNLDFMNALLQKQKKYKNILSASDYSSQCVQISQPLQ